MATYEENLAQMSQPYEYAPLPIRGGGQGRAFSGLLGDIFGGGGVSGLEEYLTPAQTEQMNRQALLQAAIAASQASAPSTTPRSFMQILGAGLSGGQQGYAQAQQGAIAQLLTKQKLDEYKRQVADEQAYRDMFTQVPVAGGVVTPMQAAALPVAQYGLGPTTQRDAMINQPMPAGMPAQGGISSLTQTQRDLLRNMPAKEGRAKLLELLQQPEITGNAFKGADGNYYYMTKQGPILASVAPAAEITGPAFRAADGNFYYPTKEGPVPASITPAPKPVGQPQQMMGPNGKPVFVQMYDDDTNKVVTGFTPLIQPEKIDTGGGVRFIDPYEIPSGTVFPKTLPPQVVGSAEGGYFAIGGGGGRGGMPTAPQAAPAPQAFPTRGSRAPAAAPIAPAAARPQPIIPGTGKAPPQDFLTKSYGIQNTNDAVNNFIGVVSKFQSSDMVDPTRRAELSSAHARAMLYAKELFNLGVLNAGDEVILNKVLMNPVDFSSAAVPIEAVRKQADDLQKVVQSSASNLSKTYKQPTIELNKYVPPKVQGFAEGAEDVSKSGKPIVYRNGAWEYK